MTPKIGLSQNGKVVGIELFRKGLATSRLFFYHEGQGDVAGAELLSEGVATFLLLHESDTGFEVLTLTLKPNEQF